MEPLPAPAVRILGVDPGTLLLGYGVLDARGAAIVHVESGVLAAPASWEAARRLGDLSKRLEEVIERMKPAAIAMEASFFGKNPNSLIRMGEARGMVLALAGRAGLAVHDYPPATVKVAVTGRGAASKEQVGRVLAALLPGMPRIEAGSPLDRTDALAVAWCHLQRRKRAAVEERLAQAARRR
jgi:crossover junction endodeoxyribonuclease RuvC